MKITVQCVTQKDFEIPDNFTESDFDEITHQLITSDQIMINDEIGEDYGAGPLRDCYKALIEIDMVQAIMSAKRLGKLQGFVHIKDYPQALPFLKGEKEFGAMNNIRFFVKDSSR